MTSSQARAGVFISGRNKSTRLPGKLFLPVGASDMLGLLIGRMQRVALADIVLITTSVHDDDAIFAEVASTHGCGVFFGSEDDKLQRYLDAAHAHDLEFMVIVDADDTFVDAWVVDTIIARYRQAPADFIIIDELPLGGTGFGISRSGLTHACSVKTNHDTEIWGSHFTDDPMLRCERLMPPSGMRRANFRLTLDYQEDYDLMRAVAEALGEEQPDFSLADVCAFLDEHPELANSNKAAHERWQLNTQRQIEKQDRERAS